MVTINHLDAPLGAEVTGLDLSRTLSDEEFAAIESVLHDRALLVVRAQQNTTPEQHIAFSRRFGDLEVHVQGSFLLPGYPEIYRISNCVTRLASRLGWRRPDGFGTPTCPIWRSQAGVRCCTR